MHSLRINNSSLLADKEAQIGGLNSDVSTMIEDLQDMEDRCLASLQREHTYENEVRVTLQPRLCRTCMWPLDISLLSHWSEAEA